MFRWKDNSEAKVLCTRGWIGIFRQFACLDPSKAGKRRDELEFIVAWYIYDTYFEEHKKTPTSEELSIRASERLGEILKKDPMDKNADYILPRSTARDYITRFKKVTGGN